MAWVRTANLDHVDTHGLAARDCPARLSLKPSSSARSALGGGWWPRSTAPATLQSVLATLSEREAGVVRLRGRTDGQPRTLDEIGQVYGVTRERIRQIESKTMSKLRHPPLPSPARLPELTTQPRPHPREGDAL